MGKDLVPSTRNLGILFLLVLVAYIFYFLGSQAHQQLRVSPLDKTCDQPGYVGDSDTTIEIESIKVPESTEKKELCEERLLKDMREMEARLRKEMQMQSEELREVKAQFLQLKEQSERGLGRWLNFGRRGDIHRERQPGNNHQ